MEKQKKRMAEPSSSLRKLKMKSLSRFLFGLFLPGAFWRLGDETLLERAGRHAHVTNFAIDHSFDALQVRQEAPLGNRGDVRANAAFFLGFAAAPNMRTLDGSLAG